VQEDNLISINLWLAGRSYRIRVKPEDEAVVRKAVKLADERVTAMKFEYSGKDDQDYLAMVLLTYAADAATDANNNPLTQSAILEMADRIQQTLDAGD